VSPRKWARPQGSARASHATPKRLTPRARAALCNARSRVASGSPARTASARYHHRRLRASAREWLTRPGQRHSSTSGVQGNGEPNTKCSRKLRMLTHVIRWRRSARTRALDTSNGHMGGTKASPPFANRSRTLSVYGVISSRKHHAIATEASRTSRLKSGGHH